MLFKETKHASIPTGHAFLTFLCFLEDCLSALAPYLLSLQLLINAVTQEKKASGIAHEYSNPPRTFNFLCSVVTQH